MLRLLQSPGRPVTIIALEGKLTSPWVPELRAAVDSARATGTVRLNLSALSWVDHDGANLLRSLRDSGVELAAASIFIEELLANPGL
jgi:ABC-type transporter Mla MlaB component